MTRILTSLAVRNDWMLKRLFERAASGLTACRRRRPCDGPHRQRCSTASHTGSDGGTQPSASALAAGKLDAADPAAVPHSESRLARARLVRDVANAARWDALVAQGSQARGTLRRGSHDRRRARRADQSTELAGLLAVRARGGLYDSRRVHLADALPGRKSMLLWRRSSQLICALVRQSMAVGLCTTAATST